MKKFLFLIILLTLITACSKKEYILLQDIPDNYSLKDAKADKCVVFENSDITSGKSIWDSFVKTTSEGKVSAVRLGYYYTLDDPSRYSKEYYDEIKDDYPVLYMQDLSFDGNKYFIEFIEDGQLRSKEYSYLMKYDGKPKSPSATFAEYTFYVLVDDNTVTWDEIERGMLSSKLGDAIDHVKVYSDYIWK